ncbi:hypothetical protein ACFL5O_07985 [Myxococcota bacterium]
MMTDALRKHSQSRLQRVIGYALSSSAMAAACWCLWPCGSDNASSAENASGFGPGSGQANGAAEDRGGSAAEGVDIEAGSPEGREPSSGGAGAAMASAANGSAATTSAAGLPLSPPERRRIAVGGGVARAISQSSSVVCWGQWGDDSGSYTALEGSYRTLAMGPSLEESLCGVADDGSMGCAVWTGVGKGPGSRLEDCVPTGQFSDVAVDRSGTDYLAAVSQSAELQVIMPPLDPSFRFAGECRW